MKKLRALTFFMVIMCLSGGASTSYAQTIPHQADRQAEALTCIGVYLNVIAGATDKGGDYNAQTGLDAASDVYQTLAQKSEDEMSEDVANKVVELQNGVQAGTLSLDDVRMQCDAVFMADKPMI